MFNKNDIIEAYYDDGWYSGVVYKLNSDGTYVIHFDDGDIADDIRYDEIRLPQNNNKNNTNNKNYVEDDDDGDIWADEFKPSPSKFILFLFIYFFIDLFI